VGKIEEYSDIGWEVRITKFCTKHQINSSPGTWSIWKAWSKKLRRMLKDEEFQKKERTTKKLFPSSRPNMTPEGFL
jgi:hypothetical protein